MAPMRMVRRDAKISLVASLSAFALLTGISIREFSRHGAEAAWVQHSHELLAAVADYRFDIRSAESARRGFALTGRESDAAAHDEALASARANATTLVQETADNPAQSARAAAVAALTEDSARAAARLIAARRAGRVAEAADMVRRRTVTTVTDRALEAADAFAASERALLAERRERDDGLTRRARGALFAAAFAAIAAALGALGLQLKDMAAREAIDRDLERTRALLQTVLDNVQASVYLMDDDGRLLFVNRECARTLGGSPESVQGRPLAEFLSPADCAAVLATNRGILESGAEAAVEETYVGADGARTYLAHKVPMSRAGGPRYLCGVSTDITDRLRHEREMLAVNRELEAFTYSVSHDLRAPLRAIAGFSRIIAEDHAAELTAEPRRLFGRIVGNVEKMGRLIDDLLDFSRLGRAPLRLAQVDMNALASRALEEAAASEPGRVVDASCARLPPCPGDAAMLAQVWRNLVQNAFKYSRPAPAARVEIGGEASPEAVRYWVADNGVGFDPRYRDKLFAVFSRLHSAEEFEGTGVGLALVRRVVERHGGSVSAAGSVGGGARFEFTIPSRRNA